MTVFAAVLKRWGVLSALVVGCGAPPAREPLTELVQRAEAALPPAPAGTLSADGFGPTAFEAQDEARRAVLAKLPLGLEHPELIQVSGLVERPGGFTARAILFKDKAARVLAVELEADRARLARLGPTLEEALVALDASVLLSTAHSPRAHLDRQRQKAALLEALGHPELAATSQEAPALEARIAPARQRALIRLGVEGAVPEPLRQAALETVRQALAARGCRVAEASAALPADGPGVEGRLILESRDHQEGGMLWRYLGLELQLKDARSGRSLLSLVARPELAHAGGRTWALVDQALARRVEEKMAERAAAFLGVSCR